MEYLHVISQVVILCIFCASMVMSEDTDNNNRLAREIRLKQNFAPAFGKRSSKKLSEFLRRLEQNEESMDDQFDDTRVNGQPGFDFNRSFMRSARQLDKLVPIQSNRDRDGNRYADEGYLEDGWPRSISDLLYKYGHA